MVTVRGDRWGDGGKGGGERGGGENKRKSERGEILRVLGRGRDGKGRVSERREWRENEREGSMKGEVRSAERKGGKRRQK